MLVTNPHGWALDVPALGLVVGAGETVDAPDDIAASLAEQGWKVAKPKAAKADNPTDGE